MKINPLSALVSQAILFVGISCASVAAPPVNYEALVEAAVESVHWDTRKDMAFTETSTDSDGEWVGRYDPRLKVSERWTLLSFDGRVPTDKESARFLADKDKDREKDGDSDGNDQKVGAMMDSGSLSLVKETDEYWMLSFTPANEDGGDGVGKKVMRSLFGRIKIMKDGGSLAFIAIRNQGVVKPKIGVKIQEFLTKMTFGPAVPDGPVVMKLMDFKLKMRAVLFVSVNESKTLAYSNFEYVGDDARVQLGTE